MPPKKGRMRELSHFSVCMLRVKSLFMEVRHVTAWLMTKSSRRTQLCCISSQGHHWKGQSSHLHMPPSRGSIHCLRCRVQVGYRWILLAEVYLRMCAFSVYYNSVAQPFCLSTHSIWVSSPHHCEPSRKTCSLLMLWIPIYRFCSALEEKQHWYCRIQNFLAEDRWWTN